MSRPPHEITQILCAVTRGDAGAVQDLFSAVYAELRRVAASKMAREKPGHTLQATALVHEAWLRLGGDAQPPWENRAHFFGAAAEAMRQILVASARRKQAIRHGGGQQRVGLDEVEIVCEAPPEELLAVSEALDRLAAHDPQKAELVKLRYFIRLTNEQAADVLRISPATAKRHWVFARAWLYDAIRGR
jgi:RNA polymerase sigma factor (TIGR02999 family)